MLSFFRQMTIADVNLRSSYKFGNDDRRSGGTKFLSQPNIYQSRIFRRCAGWTKIYSEGARSDWRFQS